MSTTTQETVQSNSSETAGTMQLVSFHLAEETFGVEITKVREIILMCEITRVPQTPHYVKGLINLRSTVIPVIDLRTLFGLPDAPGTTAHVQLVWPDDCGPLVGPPPMRSPSRSSRSAGAAIGR